MKPFNKLSQLDEETLSELVKAVMVTPNQLHPAQEKYVAQIINLYDHEEDIMVTMQQLNQAMDHLAECTTFVPEDLRAALIKDIKLMSRIFNLLHSLKARPYVMS